MTFYSGGEEKEGKYLEKENTFFLEEKKTEKEKEENICRFSVQKSSRILKSLGFGRTIWSRKESLGFGFGKFGIGKKVSVSVWLN